MAKREHKRISPAFPAAHRPAFQLHALFGELTNARGQTAIRTYLVDGVVTDVRFMTRE